MKRPIAIGLTTVALGLLAPVTYHASQSSAEARPKSDSPIASSQDREKVRAALDEVRAFGHWLEGAQMVRYVEAANFFDYLRAVEAARQGALAGAHAPQQQPQSSGVGNGLDAIRQCESGGNYQAVSSS